jgi:hypothetical protein
MLGHGLALRMTYRSLGLLAEPVGLDFAIGQTRNGERGEDRHDDHHDHELDQRKPA